MSARWVVLLAASLYLVAMGCALMPDPGPPPPEAAEEAAAPRGPSSFGSDGAALRAVGMQIQRTDWIDRYEASIDEIADLGANAVKLVVDARQENGSSTRLYLDLRMTPSVEQLERLIRHARSRNLRVILMPIVLLDRPTGNEWRGTIKPESWPAWFESYREMLIHFAWVAEANGVDLLVVGSELVSSESREAEWRETIRAVRAVYRGRLTYSSNWDHYTAVTFWDDLDLIGMNSYWKLGEGASASVEEIASNWERVQRDLLPFVEARGKPLIFLEAGWCSLANAAHEPWDYTRIEEPIDLGLQERLYEGFFRTWHGHPRLGGFSMWEWTPGDGGEQDRGYTPEGKPAEQVLRRWLAKPAWSAR